MTQTASGGCGIRANQVWPIGDDDQRRRDTDSSKDSKEDTKSTWDRGSESQSRFESWEDLDRAEEHIDDKEASAVISYLEEITSKLSSGEIERDDSDDIPEDTYTQRHRQVIKKGAKRDGS